jgi:hypothetical protein
LPVSVCSMHTVLQLGAVQAQICAVSQMEQLQPLYGCNAPIAGGHQEATTVLPPSAIDKIRVAKIQVVIEVSLDAASTAPFDEVKQRLQKLLSSKTLRLREGQLQLPVGEDEFLDRHVHEVCITTDGLEESHIGRSFFAWELDFCIRHAAAACNSCASP